MIKGSFYEFLKDGWANLFGETVKSFGEYSKNEFVPHNLERNCIVYTGTHDFNTAKGWFESVACHLCCKFAMALYPDLTHSSKDKYLLPVIQSSLISIMMQTATLRSD